MTILEGDIKLLASRVMDDVPEGGGGPTGTVIPYGGSNNIFRDITEADRAGGNVSIMQVHAAVMTANAEPYMGANFILSMPPTDSNVSITLAKCGLFARRTEIATAVANYLVQASEWSGYLLENHVAGQRSLQIIHRPGTPAPPIGRTLVLVHNEGLPNELIQYVRVTRVTTTERTFSYITNNGYVDFQASVSEVDISDVLRYNFPGSPPDRGFARQSTKTLIRDTTVADAATYYGASPTVISGAVGDTLVRVESIYTQVVPNSRTETIALDQRPSATRTITLATSPRTVSVGACPHSMRVKIGQENRSFSQVDILKPLPEPGTVEVSFMALGVWYTLFDDGQGTLKGQGAGTINYSTGSLSVTLPVLPDVSSSIIYAWGERQAYENMSGLATFRTPEFSFDLEHKGIDPGSLSVTWHSGGALKTAVADAKGFLSGDATGYLSHTHGMITIRPVAMLDAGGEFQLSYTWSPVVTETKTGLTASNGGLVTFSTDQVPVEGSVMVEWFTTRSVSSTSGSKLASGSSTKSSSSNSGTQAAQVIDSKTTHISGYYQYTNVSGGGGGGGGAVNGGITMPPPTWVPSRNQVNTTARVTTSTVTSDSASGSSSKLTITSSQVSETVISVFHNITENGSGGFLNSLGVINYAGKNITLKVVDPSTTATSYASDTESAADFSSAQTNGSSDPGQAATGYANYVPANANSLSGGSGGSSSSQGGNFYSSSVKEEFDSTALYVTYRTGTATATPHTETYAPAVVQIDLAPYTTSRIVPGSIQFTWMGHLFQDVEGILYRNPVGNSQGTTAGTVDYVTGIVNVTDYVVAGSPTNFALNSLWVSKGSWTTSRVFFRTPLAPLKPSGLVLSILDVSGNQIIATTNLDGEVVGDHCLGKIDYQTGTVDLIFGDMVLAADLTPEEKAEWWYAKALTQITADGRVWRPWPVDPNSLRFNSVAYFYLPLDADIIGLDPVRLPPDGRVPIYRAGSYVVVGHTGVVPAATYAAGQTINCGRTRLSRVYLVGADGKLIRTGYTPDLDAGTIAVTDVTGWAQPVTVKHRIEEMARVADVQIDGTLKLTKQLSHPFPVGSVVSSAIMAGNLRARALPVFDQQSWDGVTWSDIAVGNSAPATYNDGAFPVVVTNAGAVTERFALRVLTGGTDVEVIGEHVGNLGTYSRNTAIAPVNPISGAPYFTLPAAGWGAGWVPGNTLFLHTVGAYYPLAVIRATQPSSAVGTDYAFELTERGDVDRTPTNPVI